MQSTKDSHVFDLYSTPVNTTNILCPTTTYLYDLTSQYATKSKSETQDYGVPACVPVVSLCNKSLRGGDECRADIGDGGAEVEGLLYRPEGFC